jgi:tetratricopeptide (TPR) repeat protein
MNRHLRRRWIGLLGVLLFAACARQPELPRCTAPEDNPPHHYTRGMTSIETHNLDDARTKLNRAVQCDERYAPAHAGLALIHALQAARQSNEGYRQVDATQALDALKQAKRYSKTPEARFSYHTTAIRVYTALHGEDWLDDAQDHYRESQELQPDASKLPYYQGREAATYFMGLAYFRGAHDFSRARDLFRQVLDTKREGKWHEKADAAWRKADKVARATAGITIGNVARKLALQDDVSRGDLAALLIDEVKIDQLFAGRIPVQAQVKAQQASFTPADVLEHPFKQEILTLMKWNVRGLEPQYDPTTTANLFHPNQAVSRKALAIVLEDVVIKLTGDETLASKFLGQDASPFPDVKPTVSWFNAAMTAVTRNLMEAGLSGEFRPDESADGAEVLLATRMLKQRLNLY